MNINKKTNYILLCILCILFACNNKKASNIPLKDIDDHRMYQDKNSIKKVKNEYQKLLEEHPDSEEAYYLLARCEESEQKSINYLNNSLEINPEFYYSLVSLGNIYSAQNNYKQSEAYYRKAIKINPRNFMAYHNFYSLYIDKASQENDNVFKIKFYENALWALKSASRSNEGYNKYKEQDNNYYKKRISALEDEIKSIRKIREINGQKRQIQEEKRIQQSLMCSSGAQEDFLRERLNKLDWIILSFQHIKTSNCANLWWVQTIDDYGIDRFCSITTEFVSGEIIVTNTKCK